MPKKQKQKQKRTNEQAIVGNENNDSGYLFRMSYAPQIDEKMGLGQTLPLIFSTAVIIVIVRMVTYEMPMEQFYWYFGEMHNDFFSYCKMIAILICAALVLMYLFYRVFSQSLAIKRTFVYIPMTVYSLFVVISYFLSEYKDFALLGFGEKFEGTLVLLSYMILLFYAINTINTEKNIKYILYPLAASGALLSLLGISQAIGRDFFRTKLGGMLITPPNYWDKLDSLTFTFNRGQIYQTVYNINYVSLYLTLLLPLFGLLFINSITKGRDEKLVKKIIWGSLFALLLFNLIGSESSGGFLGMFVVVVVAVFFLNKKLLSWWKPLAILIAVTVLVGAATIDRWAPEVRSAAGGVVSSESRSSDYIDYMEVFPELHMIELSINGNGFTVTLLPDMDFAPDIYDANGKTINVKPYDEEKSEYRLDDERFDMCAISGEYDEKGNTYFMLRTGRQIWKFFVAEGGMYFVNGVGKYAEIVKAEAIGFKNNPGFGSGRGYIWSRTFPLMRDTLLIGKGADTYAIYFPHNDYIGKFNAGWKINNVVDKPHNMYMHMAVGTGGISLIAFLTLLGYYFVQSIGLYRRRDFDEFVEISGFGIFLGILGFVAAGLVNDSSVSVMPMFYGLLGTGIAINIMIKRRDVSVG